MLPIIFCLFSFHVCHHLNRPKRGRDWSPTSLLKKSRSKTSVIWRQKLIFSTSVCFPGEKFGSFRPLRSTEVSGCPFVRRHPVQNRAFASQLRQQKKWSRGRQQHLTSQDHSFGVKASSVFLLQSQCIQDAVTRTPIPAVHWFPSQPEVTATEVVQIICFVKRTKSGQFPCLTVGQQKWTLVTSLGSKKKTSFGSKLLRYRVKPSSQSPSPNSI